MRPQLNYGLGLVLFASLPWPGLATDILSSSGFSNCQQNASVKVNGANVSFNRASGVINFDLSGESTREQKVNATLAVTVYGIQVFQKAFDPCDSATKVDQLCPVPSGTFSAKGSQNIPSAVLSQIPSVAFLIPDLDGDATLRLTSADGGGEVGCIQSGVSNGKSLEIPAVSYVAIGIAGSALALTGISAFSSAGSVGTHAPTVGFMTIFGWFQSVSITGMMSVNYPSVYRNFNKNFAFSTGLIPWSSMQTAIDNFRSKTGGNLTENNVDYLNNATLSFTDGQSNTTAFVKRGSEYLEADIFLTVRGSLTLGSSNSTDANTTNKFEHTVFGIEGYAEQLKIPTANTFMTVLLIFAIVIATIAVGILFFKLLLETWALFGSFPRRLTSFRKRYWRVLAKTITNLILLFYGIWTTWCIFQFTNGDSWAARVLASVSLSVFTAILLFFAVKIVIIARTYKKAEGDASALYENKEMWLKYSLFYDSYKKSKWWIFIPVILSMFARGCALAAGNGHGLAQTSAQLFIEAAMFIFLLWNRPFATMAANFINIFIQVVRVLSIVCVLVFVEKLGLSQTTKTITGVVLIAVQALLSIVLAVLIAVNAIIVCCKENPHRRQRKDAEKFNPELENLTPLYARDSLLLGTVEQKQETPRYKMSQDDGRTSYSLIPNPYSGRRESGDNLVASAAPLGHARPTSIRTGDDELALLGRQPTIPDLGRSSSYHDRRG